VERGRSPFIPQHSERAPGRIQRAAHFSQTTQPADPAVLHGGVPWGIGCVNRPPAPV
jgi:hypothetical protein